MKAILTIIIPVGFISIFAYAKVRMPAKATVDCQHCTLVMAKADIIEKELEDSSKQDKNSSAVKKTITALADFLSIAQDLDQKEMKALLRAWSVVSKVDVFAAIPTHPDIQSKISDQLFVKIQNAATDEADRYCQPTKSKTPQPPCSNADQVKKDSLMAIANSISQAMYERDEQPQDNQ